MGRSVITGTGSYIPSEIKTNKDFTKQHFFAEDSTPIKLSQDMILEKFRKITGIEERRYITADLNTSDIATIAAQKAISDSGINPEALDMIIVAHNFGNVQSDSIQSDMVPAIASRVKHDLKIKNPNCIGYDILFGCPGWIQALIQADVYFKAGMATKALIIGAETLSRVIDIYDRDSMIFSDGAGATILEYKKDERERGVLSACAVSHCLEEAYYLRMGPSYSPGMDPNVRYMKMTGKKVYEHAMRYVPEAMKTCLDKSGYGINDLKKIFIHQANEKMDEAIVKAMYKLYGFEDAPKEIMPMSIHYLGNSSVATIPTLYDLVRKGMDADHSVSSGDLILFASVGAGMNINAVCYRI